MPDAEFYIAFAGIPAHYPALQRTFDRLRSAMAQRDEQTDINEVADAIERAVGEDDAPGAVGGPGEWGVGDILWNILHGEYELVELKFDGSEGRLVYDPMAFPFGGTDPLKALVKFFGFVVTRDSFWDGFAERHGQT